jgi:hypothetical protein
VLTAPSLAAAVQLLSAEPYATSLETIFVIGGAAAFAEVLTPGSPVQCNKLYLTRIYKEIACDVSIPPVDASRFAITACKVRVPRASPTACATARVPTKPLREPPPSFSAQCGWWSTRARGDCTSAEPCAAADYECTIAHQHNNLRDAMQPRATENDIEYQICTYENRELNGLAVSSRPTSALPPRHEEHQYLDAIR